MPPAWQTACAGLFKSFITSASLSLYFLPFLFVQLFLCYIYFVLKIFFVVILANVSGSNEEDSYGIFHIFNEDCFPVIMVILNAYKVDSFLMHYPYSDLGSWTWAWERWSETYSTNSAIFSLSPGQDAWQIIVLQKCSGLLQSGYPSYKRGASRYVWFMPFRTEPATPAVINRIMKENGIPPQYTSNMQQVYYNLPVVEMQSLITTLQHLITAFIPGFAANHVEYINYTSEQHEVDFNEERIHKFTSDYMANLAEHIKSCGDAVITGDQTASSESMKSLLNFAVSFSETPLSQLKEYLSYINTFLSAKMMDTQVHPAYIFKQMHTFQLKINETVQAQELQHLPYEMVRKYCLLVKNFTYDNYSYLIRSVVNYINQHLSSELSLATLASEFGKNASYLSSEFKKEVGDTLTTYINKHRILASLRYFNTTDMSVAEVSNAVGYTDMGYFSRLFRKYVGQSPREYKKMLDK